MGLDPGLVGEEEEVRHSEGLFAVRGTDLEAGTRTTSPHCNVSVDYTNSITH
jgi:hypothetical protein